MEVVSPYPTIVPTPTSLSTVTPATDVKSSGAEEPAAMKVAPATSSDSSSFSEIASSDGTKKSSQTIAMAEGESMVLIHRCMTATKKNLFDKLLLGLGLGWKRLEHSFV